MLVEPVVIEKTIYTAKNVTDLLQVVNFTGLMQFVNKLQQACQFHQVATSLLRLQACCNLSLSDLLQLVETICNKPVEIINLQQVC